MEVDLPEQVKRQLDEAAAIERQMFGQPAPEGNTESADIVPETPADPQPVENIQPAPVATPEVSEETWQQKFYVLRGKYEAEVPRLNAQVKELSAQIQAIMAQASKPEPVKDTSLVTDADVEAYGKDMIDMIRRAAREEATREARRLEEKVEHAVKPVQERLVVSETQRFWSAVDAAVPDFVQVNDDPRWVQLLDSRIPGTRSSYRAAAEMAIANHDAEALIEMINNWKHMVAPPPAPQGQAAPSKAQAELQRQVAPTSRKAQEAPPQAKVFTAKEFEYWHDPRRAYDTDKALVARMQEELDLASAENRVQW